jgi:hypothetical protein
MKRRSSGIVKPASQFPFGTTFFLPPIVVAWQVYIEFLMLIFVGGSHVFTSDDLYHWSFVSLAGIIGFAINGLSWHAMGSRAPLWKTTLALFVMVGFLVSVIIAFVSFLLLTSLTFTTFKMHGPIVNSATLILVVLLNATIAAVCSVVGRWLRNSVT